MYIMYYNYFNSRIENTINDNTAKKTTKLSPIKKIKEEVIKSKTPNLIIEIKYKSRVETIEVELFDKDVPLTCKNFREIAINGINGKTYNNSIFHRVIKDFMLQGGDILNSNGTGSTSIYGTNFNDENFKYKHDTPGLLSMANSGPNTNGSQFFITTVPTPHLDNIHVVFGKVVKGLNSILNLQNIETDNDDAPISQLKILNIKNK